MAFDTQLANAILEAARERFPEAVGNLEHLKDLTGIREQSDDDWSAALRALEAEGLVQFHPAIRTGIDQYFRGFVNMTVTSKGRTTNIAA